MNRKRSPRLAKAFEDTEDNDLVERMKKLELENLKLRGLLENHGIVLSPTDSSNANRERKRPRRGSTAAPIDATTPKTSGRGGCSCKGNCGTRVCGCVKKNAACSEFCKCSNALCQNLEADKENIGDQNNLPEHSKKTPNNRAKQSKSALRENGVTSVAHPAFEPADEPVAKVNKPRSLFSPVVNDREYKFETTGDIEFENISFQFGDEPVAETAVAEKGSKKSKDVAGPSSEGNKKIRIPSDDESGMEQEEEATQELVEKEITGKRVKKIETKKWKVAPLKNNKRQASKARNRNENSDSEAEEGQLDNDEDEEEQVQKPVKGKGKAKNAKKETKKAKPVAGPANNSEFEAEDDDADNKDNVKKRVKGKAPIKTNDKKKETKKGQTVSAPAKNMSHTSRARIRSNSESEDETDNESSDEEMVKEPVKEGTRGKKNNVQGVEKLASPTKNVKRNMRRARIESGSESDYDEMVEVEEKQEAEKEKKNLKKNDKNIESNKARKNQVEAGPSSKDDEPIERDLKNKKNTTETMKEISNKQKKNAVVSDDSSDETDSVFEHDDDDHAKQNDIQIETQEGVRNEQAELSPFSTDSNDPEVNYPTVPDFDPMKPRRQLSRSPVHSQNESHIQKILDRSEIPLPVPIKEEVEDQPPEPDELKADVVDWEQHQANLVGCSKCGRRFHAHRLKKHEATCLNI